MERTFQQQTEIDEIERCILTALFGSERVPDKTAILLKLARINPNVWFQKLESKLIPVMNCNGKVNGNVLKTMLKVLQPNVCEIIEIPDSDFYVSSLVPKFLQVCFPNLR